MLVYTLTLLLGFLPLMPFEPRTREFELALLAACAIFIAGGVYVIRGEAGEKARPLWALKMLVAAALTTFAAIVVLVFDLVTLFRA